MRCQCGRISSVRRTEEVRDGLVVLFEDVLVKSRTCSGCVLLIFRLEECRGDERVTS